MMEGLFDYGAEFVGARLASAIERDRDTGLLNVILVRAFAVAELTAASQERVTA
jgi:hypothetical protein